MSAGKSGERNTVQKEAIQRALEAAPGFVSARQLHRTLEADGTRVGLVTVYRRLHALVEAGQADTLLAPGERLFRACHSGGHHHHLVCEGCGKVVEIDPPNEEWIRAAARTHSFTVTHHFLEVFGSCASCAAA